MAKKKTAWTKLQIRRYMIDVLLKKDAFMIEGEDTVPKCLLSMGDVIDVLDEMESFPDAKLEEAVRILFSFYGQYGKDSQLVSCTFDGREFAANIRYSKRRSLFVHLAVKP